MQKTITQPKITDPTNPKQIPQKMESLTTPKQEIPITPIKPPQPKQEQPKPQQTPKPIPQEILILTRAMEEIEGIIYGARNQILQLYGPVDYSNISDIELRFTEEQASKLFFDQKERDWIIRPRQFLGEKMFADVAATVKALGGEYISAGRDSHFRVKRS